jgi:heterodisulfide reductase subunit B
MKGAIYLKQHLLETNSHYEERVNNYIVTVSEKYKFLGIETKFRQVTIYFETNEPLQENSKRKIDFPVTSNNI